MDAKNQAAAEKDKGNDAYKQRDFKLAHEHYDKAIQLDPENVTFKTNKAAAFFEEARYDECIAECEKAIEQAREQRADYKLIAKALTRIGNAYWKKDDLENAVKYFNKSIIEHRDPEVSKKILLIQKQILERERLAYIDPLKAEEEKDKGNQKFRDGNFPDALSHYSDAIKRNPDDAKLYSNRAACYTKLARFDLALKDCDECIRLDPKFIKGYLRKGATLVAMKENIKAQDIYQKALEMDPNCAEAIDGYRKAMLEGSSNPEDVRRQAMSNPEVQAILADPAMQMILQQMQSDPKALKEHLKNPDIAKKIEKLLECGLIAIR